MVLVVIMHFSLFWHLKDEKIIKHQNVLVKLQLDIILKILFCYCIWSTFPNPFFNHCVSFTGALVCISIKSLNAQLLDLSPTNLWTGPKAHLTHLPVGFGGGLPTCDNPLPDTRENDSSKKLSELL